MKIFLATLAMLLSACAANAQTAGFAFTEAVDGSYVCSYSPDVCTGYDSADPAHQVNSAAIRYTGSLWSVTLSVDGISYTGLTGHQGTNFTLKASGQPNITANVSWVYKPVCHQSGRVAKCVAHYFINSGEVYK
jgi:hypothetical protein